jgi:PBSX family phage terminase large subunit
LKTKTTSGFTRKQEVILDSYNRDQPYHLIMEGAVRSGKTYLNNLLFMSHVVRTPTPPKSFILTGRTIGSIERNVLAPLEEFTGRTIRMNNFNQFHLGAHRVCCFGTADETSYKAMQGMTSFGWYANEVSTHHPNSIIEAFQRCSGEGTRVFWDTNPDHPFHPVKTEYIDHSGLRGADGQLLLKSFHFTLEDNEYLTPEYMEQVRRTTPAGMWYDRRIKGLWVAAEGIIYESFHRDKHMYDPKEIEIPEDWRRIRGIDFGTVHPFVMLWGAIDPDGRLYIYREYFKTQTLIRGHAEHIKKVSGEERYWWTVSDHDAQERLEYESHDIPTQPAQKAVLLGIDRVAQRMVDQIDGRPRVMISQDCPELLRQLGTYRWVEMQDGKPYREEPLKVDDDGPDVLRYMIMELDNNTTPIISKGFRGGR